MKFLNVYECRRFEQNGNDWMGALLIAARTEEQANSIFAEIEGEPAKDTLLMDGVYASGDPRVIYDNDPR